MQQIFSPTGAAVIYAVVALFCIILYFALRSDKKSTTAPKKTLRNCLNCKRFQIDYDKNHYGRTCALSPLLKCCTQKFKYWEAADADSNK